MKGDELSGISTKWSVVQEPAQFVIRYAPAIHRFLKVYLRNAHDAEEVAQEFLLQVTRIGFARVDPDRGRFRNYLIASLRNAARAHLARKHARPTHHDLLPQELADENHAERECLAEWRRCLLDAAWRGLHAHEQQTSGNLCHTILRLAVDHPEATSQELASRAAAQSGQALTAEAFRKQLSRARRLFAELLVAEAENTLDEPTPADVAEELNEVGLTGYVRPFLAPGRLP